MGALEFGEGDAGGLQARFDVGHGNGAAVLLFDGELLALAVEELGHAGVDPDALSENKLVGFLNLGSETI